MPIPELGPDGFLPPGIHDATLPELEAVFGAFRSSDVRQRLFRKLMQYVREVRSWGRVEEILVDGSFVSSKEKPSDIDIILVYPAGFDFGAPLSPQEYNVVKAKRVRKKFGFDLKPVSVGSIEREKWVSYFSSDTRTGKEGKGLVRLLP